MVRLQGAEVRFRKPVIYQTPHDEAQGPGDEVKPATAGAPSRLSQTKLVEGHYVLRGRHEVGFAISAYDRSRPLVIDPVLAYSTYSIGMGAVGLGLDGPGDAYLLGRTYSGGVYQASVMALNPQGNQVIFTTNFGPTGGSNGPSAIAVDPQGDAYITGNGATGMPTTPGAFQATCPAVPSCNTPFAAKFTSTGTLEYATFLGPSNAAAKAIAFDSSGDAYITGTVASNDLPVVDAFQSQMAGGICTSCANAFVQKLNPTGSQFIFSTYFSAGGLGTEVIGNGIAVDASGSTYIVGNGASIPLKNPLEQGVGGAFLAKFTPDGAALVYSTLLGGSGGAYVSQMTEDTAVAVAVDTSGDAYVTGEAASPDFPLTMNAYKASCNESALEACVAPQVYVLKVDPNGTSLIYSTLVGAGTVANIALDSSGDAWVAGTTSSNYYPVFQPIESSLQQNSYPESNADAFVTMLNTSGLPTFSTYLGGILSSATETGVAADNSGNVYVVGSLGGGNNVPVDFPLVNPVFPPQLEAQFAFPGGLFVSKISPGAGPALSLSPWYTNILELRDVSSSPLTISGTTVSSTLILDGGTCGSSLPPAGECTLIVYPENTQYPQGGTLTIASNASASPEIFNVAYSPIGINQVFVSRDYLEFPEQLVGSSSAAQTVTITNLDYPNSLAITSISIPSDPSEGVSGDFTQTNNCPASLAAGASCTINVRYQPTAGADGPESGQLLIDTGSAPSNYIVYLTGLRSSESVVPSTQSTQYAVPNSSVEFGTQFVGSTPLPRVLTLTNADVQPVTLSGFTLTAPFSQTNNCSAPLASHASCRVSLSFVPTANGNFTGTLSVADSGNGSPAVINLAGTGLIPSGLSVSPLTLQFGSVLAGTTASLPLTLTNVTSTTVTIADYELSANFSQTNNCGGSLAAGGTCTVTVSFSPTTLGAITGTITIQPSGNGTPQVVALYGIGTTALDISPQSLSFGQQNDGTTSPPQTVQMLNVGGAPIIISGVSISQPFVLLDNSCLTTLAVNTDCTVEVEFSPTMGVGIFAGELTVVANDLEGTHVIPLSGTGVSLPVVGLAPTSLSFPAQLVSSTSAAQAVTVTNTGAASLQVSGVNISGPFSETNTCNAAVAVKGTCSISVSFTPTGAGSESGALTLTDNAANSPQSVALSGTGEDFSLAMASGASSSSTVTPGQTATYNLSVAPASGLSGSVSFTCTGAPLEASGVVSPSTATLSASSATPITVTVTTMAGSGFGIRPQPPAPPWIWLWVLAIPAAIRVWTMGGRRFAWRRAWAPLGIAALALILWAACGGGGTGGLGNPGTPAGSYSLTITGTYTSGATTLQHNLNLSLTVN